ncbi:hypothetical protein GEV27_06640 [Aeromicrobium sp. S22]|uniref:hypothetical protein n=1 Tax=Aeromicrobium sp. S22 TaxID=2662029 RepID=UPI00129EE845|nr:hypothetical protein [Aeromicrobium sp. S22]MRK01196.1 hypothetical protein [Aeromicrobium sp. S22]
MRTRRIAAVAAAAALVLGGCSSGSEDKPKASKETTAPAGFDVPPGVKLTSGGTRLDEGKPATVVHQVGDRAASAVTVRVLKVKKGSIKDFRFFSLDAETRRSTPYYVTVKVTNDGPAGLGGAALPLFVRDDSNTQLPANDIVGTFKPCPRSTLPKSFLPGASARLCLVYLVPKGRSLVSVDLQTGAAKDAITWRP